MGRRIRTDLPQLKQRLVPDWPYLEDFRKADECHKQKQKENYDTRHRDSIKDWIKTWSPRLLALVVWKGRCSIS